MKILRCSLSVEDSLAEKLEVAERQTSLQKAAILTLLASRYLDDLLLWHSGSAPAPLASPPPIPAIDYDENNLPPVTL